MTEKKVKIAKGLKVSRKKASQMRKKAGSSNVGKYKKVPKGEFCGKAGGSSAGSYPVNSKKRARAALAYARNAPNPSGIKACVRKHFPTMGKSSKKKGK